MIIESSEIKDVPLDKLFQALIECFGVILCGYVAGRMGVVTPQQTSGLSMFVGTFSLPALIFMSLATLDLTSVCWYFLLSILISKAIVFACVLLITLLVTRPVDPGKAGLYAIFCTQSNDFAIGFPIVLSAYGKTHPEFVSYLYLLAPVSLVMLNPIGFVLMEIGKRRSRGGTTLQLLISTATSIASNPIVFMTALGIAGNFIFQHNVPEVLAGLLNVFGSAFTASALFLLGLHMVGKVQTLQGAALIVPSILIAVKELVLPVVVREVTSLVLHASSVNASLSNDMSNYGFLYGTLPAAPGVFVYATSYALDVDLIASAMVACTFLSAPLMFVSAKMVSVSDLSPNDFFPTLQKFDFDLSIAGLLACGWILALFVGGKNYKTLPHRITMFLVVSQMIECIGILIGHIDIQSIGYVEYALVTFGSFSSNLWTACLAVTMVLIESRNFIVLQTLQPVYIVLAWGLPVVLVSAMLLWVTPVNPPSHCNESFTYGHIEAGLSICILLASFLITVGSLIAQQRYRKRYLRYMTFVRETSSASEQGQINASGDMVQTPTGNDDRTQPLLVRQSSESLLDTSNEDAQITHHLVLLFFLLGSTFVSLALCIWRVIMEDITGVYVELSFLDVILKRGQSVIVLFIFGWDTVNLLQPCFKSIQTMWTGGDPIQLPPCEELPFETQHLCEQFRNHHIEQCKNQIVKNLRVHFWQYKACFTGESLVNWLISEELVKDRHEAVAYGCRLLSGRIIQHVTNTQHFADDSSLFIFLSSE